MNIKQIITQFVISFDYEREATPKITRSIRFDRQALYNSIMTDWEKRNKGETESKFMITIWFVSL